MYETPFTSWHVEHGGRMIDFFRWRMPLKYRTSIKEEHMCVRERVGVFDVSHMGEFLVEGEESEEFLNFVTANDVRKLKPGRVQYSVIPNWRGGVKDDLLVYKLDDKKYMTVVNASNREKDFHWFESYSNWFKVKLKDISFDTGLIAVQGPDSAELLKRLFGETVGKLKYYRFKIVEWKGKDVILSRTGYTGELGFELYVPWGEALSLWEEVLEAGKDFGVLPCGLGARDSLRLEAGMMLYGNDLEEDVSPYEADLSWVVKLEKGDFIGKEWLEREKEGFSRSLVGFVVEGGGFPRRMAKVFKGDEWVGYITSSVFSPLYDRVVGFALVKRGSVDLGSSISIQYRSKLVEAKVCEKNFLKKIKDKR